MFRLSNFNIFNHFTSNGLTAKYHCYTVLSFPGQDRSELDKGGKILLPPSALETLVRYHVSYPMLFQLTNPATQLKSHAGVLEFTAEEDKCYLPNWLMRHLQINEGDIINVDNKYLPIATFSKFQPQNVEFLDITNPKAVLENALRNFACLTKGDVIAIDYNKRIYELLVLETKPSDAVSIIECDMNVEFEAPVGYEELQNANNDMAAVEADALKTTTDTVDVDENDFLGAGQRLDGKKKKGTHEPTVKNRTTTRRGLPDYSYEFGTLTFDRSVLPISDRLKASGNAGENEASEGSDGFCGEGSTMTN